MEKKINDSMVVFCGSLLIRFNMLKARENWRRQQLSWTVGLYSNHKGFGNICKTDLTLNSQTGLGAYILYCLLKAFAKNVFLALKRCGLKYNVDWDLLLDEKNPSYQFHATSFLSQVISSEHPVLNFTLIIVVVSLPPTQGLKVQKKT